MTEIVHDAEIMDASAAAELVRGEVDAQIATAKRFPRSATKSLERARGQATSSVATAESCRYVLTRDGKRIEGGSIRLAEILGNCWGNLRVQSRTISEGATAIVAQGVCIDLETNTAWSKEVRRRITKRDGTRYSEDMITTTVNAAQSIAARNAVFSCVPRALWEPLLEDVRKMIRGDEKTFPARRQEMLAAFAKLRVDAETVARMTNRQRADDLTMDDLVDLRGIYQALRDGTTTVEAELEELPEGAKAAVGTKTERLTEALQRQSAAASAGITATPPATTGGPAPAPTTDGDPQPEPPPAAADKPAPEPPPAPPNEMTTGPAPLCTEDQYRDVRNLWPKLHEDQKEAFRKRFKFAMLPDVKRLPREHAGQLIGELDAALAARTKK